MSVVKLRPAINSLPKTQEEMTRRYREPDEFMTVMQNVISDYARGYADVTRAYVGIAVAAMVHYQTVKNIAEGATRFPANSTCDRILSACGYRRDVIKVEPRRAKRA